MKRRALRVVAVLLILLVAIVWGPRVGRRLALIAPRPGGLVTRHIAGGVRFDVAEVHLDRHAVRLVRAEGGLFLRDVRGLLTTNAGIFEPDLRPTGLLVIDGETIAPLRRGDGAGNFFMLPNGVFQLGASGARVLETSEYTGDGVALATQSGPLLLRNGKMHPAFRKSSAHRVIRSGVGVRGPKEIVFVISRDDVSLHDFAAFFRDTLHCPDALYLDGIISGQGAEDVGLDEDTGPFSAVFAVTAR